MFCQACGSLLQNGVSFCTACGAPAAKTVVLSPPVAPAAASAPAGIPATPIPPKKSGPGKGLGDLFKASENKELANKVAELEALLSPELRDLQAVNHQIETQEKRLGQLNMLIADLSGQIDERRRELDLVKAQIIETNDERLLQSFGLYAPRYAFASSVQYKSALDHIRQQQKEMIKNRSAVTGDTNWTVNGSKSEGKKMLADMQKLLLRAFNSECDDAIEHVKFNNIQAAEKRLTASVEAISKLGTVMRISISPAYYNLKLQELYLAYEYQIKKQHEKDEQKRIREEMREQAKLAKELEDARREIEKERKHYTNALKTITDKLRNAATQEELSLLHGKEAELRERLDALAEAERKVDYRAANQKAGYVYIISNIGAFGENVYKIGMTRRLDPMDRIDELGDASVPFDFDVHALIFSENAPALETALHNAFNHRKLNMVNTRREFFNVSLAEIENVVRANYDKTVDFVLIPPAEQYRESLLIKQSN